MELHWTQDYDLYTFNLVNGNSACTSIDARPCPLCRHEGPEPKLRRGCCSSQPVLLAAHMPGPASPAGGRCWACSPLAGSLQATKRFIMPPIVRTWCGPKISYGLLMQI